MIELQIVPLPPIRVISTGQRRRILGCTKRIFGADAKFSNDVSRITMCRGQHGHVDVLLVDLTECVRITRKLL